MNNKQSWIDQRFPLTKVFNEHLAEYYTPRNFNIWYFFGGLAILNAWHAITYWNISNNAL